MKVSIITTTYNRSEHLTSAIQSVLDQSFKDFEYIIVDDGSCSHTEYVVRKFNDNRIKYIKHPKNLGSTKSLNTGLQVARGEYITILDDDDKIIDVNKLLLQTKFLDNNPSYCLVSVNAVVVDRDGKKIKETNFPTQDEALRNKKLGHNQIVHSGIMYRHLAAVQVGGYDEALPRGKDYDLILKMGHAGKFAILPILGVQLRVPSKDIDGIRIRYEDTFYMTKIIWRHRYYYRSAWRALITVFVRRIIFKTILMLRFK